MSEVAKKGRTMGKGDRTVLQIYCQHFSNWRFKELQRERRGIPMWSRYDIPVMKSNLCNFRETILFFSVTDREITVGLSLCDLSLTVSCVPCFPQPEEKTTMVTEQFALRWKWCGLESNYKTKMMVETVQR